jgi:glucose/mannose-6-phosphate isomerase
MLQGIGTDTIVAPGKTRLANQWCCLHLGDYISYYLAMLYQVDPTPVEMIESFKTELMDM